MTIQTGDRLPDAKLLRSADGGPETVALSELISGKTVAIIGVPGAFTATCSARHIPTFIENKDAFAEKGVDTILCVSVNDPFVMKAWGEQTGATDAGLTMLSDADGSFTRALGLEFDSPSAGLIGRSRRYSMLVEDGTVKTVNIEESPGLVEVSDGATLLKDL